MYMECLVRAKFHINTISQTDNTCISVSHSIRRDQRYHGPGRGLKKAFGGGVPYEGLGRGAVEGEP